MASGTIKSTSYGGGNSTLLASGTPQSSWTATLVTVQLSDNLSNYRYIRAIEYNSNDQNTIVNEELPIDLFKNGIDIYGVYSPASSVTGGLKVRYLSDTSIGVSSFGYTGFRIYGIK